MLSFFSFLEEPHHLTHKNVQLAEGSGFSSAKGIMTGVWVGQERLPGEGLQPDGEGLVEFRWQGLPRVEEEGLGTSQSTQRL